MILLLLLIYLNQDPTLSLKESLSTFNDAFKRADVEVLDQMLTRNYHHQNDNSDPIGKAEWLTYVAERKLLLESKALEILDYEMTDVEIRIKDDQALVSGVVKTTEKRNGLVSMKFFRVQHLWVRENEKWKRSKFEDEIL
jgi:hypothetical protein